MGKGAEQKETAQERALAEVGMQQLRDFRARWQPLQMRFAQQVVAAGAPDSVERRMAAGKATTDTALRFAKANEQLVTQAAATGQHGSSREKLGITGMGADQATSSGLATAATSQAADDAYVQGLGAVTALGRGEKASAVNGMAQQAAVAGQQAAADAQSSLQERMGYAQLAGSVAGVGAGLYMGNAPKPGQVAPIKNYAPWEEGWTG